MTPDINNHPKIPPNHSETEGDSAETQKPHEPLESAQLLSEQAETTGNSDTQTPLEPTDTAADEEAPAAVADELKQRTKQAETTGNSDTQTPLEPTDTAADEEAPAAVADELKQRTKQAKKKRRLKKNIQDSDSPDSAKNNIGTAKGLETMFRNAFRAELDMIALAATKANIMISLNGFIVSALMISGAFIFASSPAFLIPAGIFMFTAAASIVFALLSASPERAGLPRDAWCWFKDVLTRKAQWRDFQQRVINHAQSPANGQPNILIYEDRVQLSKSEYWAQMQNIMDDRNEVYHKMSDQLYWLGLIANKKFKYLNMSYTVFRWGLLASVIAFVSVKSIQSIMPVLADTGRTVKLRNLGINDFENIYEPSAVQQLPDGRLLVVEDESSRAFSLMRFAEDGTLYEDEALDVRLIPGFKRKLSDLEGLAKDNDGYIYAVTSHSKNKKGERRPDREHMVRFKIEGSEVHEVSYFSNLKDALLKAHDLQKIIKSRIGTEVDFDNINIEGLLYDRKQNRLMLGFREPMVNNLSMIVVISNPKEMFERDAAPKFSDAIFLELQGGGIRALSYDPVLDTYMIVNEIKGYEDNTYSQLWTWNGDAKTAPEPVALPGIINLNNVESIDSITINGESRLMIMSDEGSEKKQRPAKYMMLDYNQLKDN